MRGLYSWCVASEILEVYVLRHEPEAEDDISGVKGLYLAKSGQGMKSLFGAGDEFSFSTYSFIYF